MSLSKESPLGSYHYLLPGQEEVNHFPQTTFFVFSSAEREEDYGAEKMTKIKLIKGIDHILINSTIFATNAVLVSVLLYFNLDSSMLKCKGSLT